MEKSTELSNTVIDAYKSGCQDALETIYKETFSMIYASVYRLTQNKEETEDLLHDIYIKLFENRKKYNYSAKISTWLYRIAVNHTLNHLKRKNSLITKLSAVFHFHKPEEISHHSDPEHPILSSLKELPSIYRLCIILRDIEEKSYEEIADILKISLSNVKNRLHRGRKLLLEYYEQTIINKDELLPNNY